MANAVEIQLAILAERRRCIGVLLEAVGIYTLSGEERLAHAINMLALQLEYPDLEP